MKTSVPLAEERARGWTEYTAPGPRLAPNQGSKHMVQQPCSEGFPVQAVMPDSTRHQQTADALLLISVH